MQGRRQPPFTETDLIRLTARAEQEPLVGLRLTHADPAKPAYLQPCNGCGVCCALEPCAIARQYIPDLADGPCPALIHDGSRYLCGMTQDPGLYMNLPNDWADPVIGHLFRAALGIGRGCDAEG